MISLIIPFYNCEKIAENTMLSLENHLSERDDIELIAVNDGSIDGTLSKLKRFEKENVRVVTYEKNLGKGGAIKAGVSAAAGDKILFTDADLAYGLGPVEDISKALDEYDIAAGTRRNDDEISKNYGLLRSLSSRIFSYLTQSFLKLDMVDTQCGFKGYRREAARSLFSRLSVYDFGFDLEILAMAKKDGMTITQVPVTLLANEKQSNVRLIRDGLKMVCEMYEIKKKLNRE